MIEAAVTEVSGIRDLKIEVWSFITVNDILQFVVNGEIVFKITFFEKNSIVNKQKSSQKSYFFSNVGRGCKKIFWLSADWSENYYPW